MKATNANFDTYHSQADKTPIYLIHFDSETTDYAGPAAPLSPTNTVKLYLNSISGSLQKITPEEGKSSIGGVKIDIQDQGDEITALLATDSYYFHRRKTVIKAGYLGQTEANMLTVFTGWVTGIKLSSNGMSYIFDVTDPQKWMQRKVFRGSEESNVTLSGNLINILLAVLTSTGNGTNGTHDRYAAADGLGLSTDYINVAAIEAVRDDWFPGPWYYGKFTINKRRVAKDFIEKEILKVLNCYPVIDGSGRYSIAPFKPPLAASETVQTFDEDVIIGLPNLDFNLASLINEVEIHYDYDEADSAYDTIVFYIDSDSLNNRGPGKKALSIKSMGLHAEDGQAGNIIEKRKNSVFSRFATPPIKIECKTWFSNWLSEAGDIIPFSHEALPDIEAGTRGLIAERMEIVSRKIDWKRGTVSLELLNTGFNKSIYGVISNISTDYTASTAAEKLYGFIANASNKLGGTSDDNVLIPGGDGVLLPGGDKLILPGGTGATGGDDAHLIVA